MKYALVNNVKTEAKKGLDGVCACCGGALIAKCGDIKIHHWAHKSRRKCDHWWENETEWHRSWKNNFPVEWQEVIMLDAETLEKHIADVRSINGLVVEFQHSRIATEERSTREQFYKNMVWVVDGTRRKRDYWRFLKGKNIAGTTDMEGIFTISSPEEYLPNDWLVSSVPVVFDFRGTDSTEGFKDVGSTLYCLFPIRIGGLAVLAEIPANAFVKAILNGEWTNRAGAFMEKIYRTEQERRNKIAREEQLLNQLKSGIMANRPPKSRRRRRGPRL